MTECTNNCLFHKNIMREGIRRGAPDFVGETALPAFSATKKAPFGVLFLWFDIVGFEYGVGRGGWVFSELYGAGWGGEGRKRRDGVFEVENFGVAVVFAVHRAEFGVVVEHMLFGFSAFVRNELAREP